MSLITRSGTTDGLLDSLASCLAEPARARTRELDRRVLAHDASHFLLLPKAVVTAADAAEVGRLMRTGTRSGTPLTFRSGGTSLSGQSVTDGILVDVRGRFSRIEVLDDGARVRVQPGVTIRQVNARLAPYGRKLGPDPASESACTIGGMLADNSSGMACGTKQNSYQTLESLVAVLPSGTVVDTGAADADARLRDREPELYAGLLQLRDRIRRSPASMATIAQQYAMKNTMGYGLNSFVDHDEAAQILAHLLIGSEGTLAFIAEATLRTIPVRGHTSSAMLIFPDVYAATQVLPELVDTGAATIELLDAASLRVGQQLPDPPAGIVGLDVDAHAALILEYQGETAAELATFVEPARSRLSDLGTLEPVQLTSEPVARTRLWTLRKGLYASVASARPAGSTALLEDIAVPVARLAGTCRELSGLFATHGYGDSVIFGHAKDGNIHFMLTDGFSTDEQLTRFGAFTEDLVELVVGEQGTLKAEHGTGRVMAPFVRRQFGDELYAVMTEVKRLFDPSGVLNPGVVLTDDPQLHLKNIKTASLVEPSVDRCVECGYCEPVCPSRHLTLTPRQRIVAQREIREAAERGEQQLVAQLDQAYAYDGVQTCAVDGMCQTACPVAINTGDLVRHLRTAGQPKVAAELAERAARHWGSFTRAGGAALSVAAAVPSVLQPVVLAGNAVARKIIGTDTLPLWGSELPAGGSRRRRTSDVGDARRPTVDAVYLPACVNAMFGPADGSPGVQLAFEQLCERAGVRLHVPAEIESLCCGTPWSSKGFPAGHRTMQQRVAEVVRAASRDEELPVICDATSCTEGFRKLLAPVGVRDVLDFSVEHLLPRLGPYDKLASITLHPTCSSTQLGLNPALLAVAGAVAEDVKVPTSWGCCAFAGDRGLLHPELTASATAAEAAEVAASPSQAYASCNRTCELGMTRATGQPYRHVIEVLAELVARPPGGDH